MSAADEFRLTCHRCGEPERDGEELCALMADDPRVGIYWWCHPGCLTPDEVAHGLLVDALGIDQTGYLPLDEDQVRSLLRAIEERVP